MKLYIELVEWYPLYLPISKEEYEKGKKSRPYAFRVAEVDKSLYDEYTRFMDNLIDTEIKIRNSFIDKEE